MPKQSGAFRNVAWTLALMGLSFALAAAVTPAAASSFSPNEPFEFRDRLYDVAFASDQVAVIVGYPGKVFRSTDAGKTWSIVKIDTREPLFSIFFLNDKTGWIAGRSGLIFKTTDAGETWAKQETGTKEHLFDVHFANEKFGIAVGNFGAILRTTDGGEHWAYQQLEAMSSASIYGVQVFDDQNAYFCGEYPTWEAQLDENVSATTLSSMFKTTDGGLTWQRLLMPDESHIFGISFENASTGYAIGTKGLIEKTTDGGLTWAKIETGVPYHLTHIERVGSAIVAVGNAGSIVRVENGAVDVPRLGLYFWLTAVSFNKAGQGVAVGNHGLVLSSADGGKTWH